MRASAAPQVNILERSGRRKGEFPLVDRMRLLKLNSPVYQPIDGALAVRSERRDEIGWCVPTSDLEDSLGQPSWGTAHMTARDMHCPAGEACVSCSRRVVATVEQERLIHHLLRAQRGDAASQASPHYDD